MLEENLCTNSSLDDASNSKIECVFKKENGIKVLKSGNNSIINELKNSANRKNSSHSLTFNSNKEIHYNQINEISEKEENIKAIHTPFFDYKENILLEKIDDYFNEKNATSGIIEIKNSTFKKKIYKIFFIRLLYAFILLIIGLYIQCYSILLSDEYYETGEVPLKDRIHELFNEIPSFLSPLFVNGSIAIFFIITVLRFGLFFPFLLSITILIRLTLILTFFYLSRSIFIYVTTLPCPIPTCKPLRRKSFFENIHIFNLIIFQKVYECTDLIISGHTAYTAILKLLWIFYEKNFYIKVIIFFYSLFIFAIIAISKFHYTVDVLMGYMFGATIFIFYHHFIDVAAKRYAVNRSFCNKNNYFSVSFLDRYNLFHYFIQAVAYLEALDHRLDVSIYYDKDWAAFCSCKPVNSKSLIIKNRDINEENYYIFSDHFYHSYSGNGSYNLSSINNIIKKCKEIFRVNTQN